MKKLALLALLLLTVVAHAAELPDTPAAKSVAGWVESYNTHDLAARKDYLKQNTALAAEQIDKYAPMDLEMRENQGKLEVVSVSSSSDHEIALVLRHATSGQELDFNIKVDEKAPHKIVGIGLRPR